MQDRENATHTAPKYLVWLREMSTTQLPYNNVILWATASCLHPLQFQHPGAILGRELTRPETHSHCSAVPAFSLFTFLPLLSAILFVLFGVGKSRVDMLTSPFLCLAGAFFFFSEVSSSGTGISAVAVNSRIQSQLQASNNSEEESQQYYEL